MNLKAPFVYFGGKSMIAHLVWQALGRPKHYFEPFFGSGAVLLARPDYMPDQDIESVVDKDGFVANVWRALQANPDAVAKVCDWPVNHADLAARKAALIRRLPALLPDLIADDKFYDVELAGYWIWAASCWIGSGLTSPGQISHLTGGGIPHLTRGGMGVHAPGQRPHLTDGGRGVHAMGQRPQEAPGGADVRDPYQTNLWPWFRALSARLRYVRVVCGDWSRVCGGDWQDKNGTAGFFFDPPYSIEAGRAESIYDQESGTVAHDVRAWCLERGDRPSHRIVLAGYEGEGHEELEAHGWRVKAWKTQGGYGKIGKGRGLDNRHRERLWFSPHCLTGQGSLFDRTGEDEAGNGNQESG